MGRRSGSEVTSTMQYRLFLGIDWGAAAHQIWVSNHIGESVGERVVPHTGADLMGLADWLVSEAAGDAAAVAVALEVPRGPIVDTLLERGCHVFAMNPTQLDRFRDRFSVAGAKDDRRDAQVLSSAIRTDQIAFRQLQVDDPRVIELREYSRQDSELGEDFRRLANRLREHLLRTGQNCCDWSPLLTNAGCGRCCSSRPRRRTRACCDRRASHRCCANTRFGA